jgi:uncharacterized membrane protein YdbT with pleckstrin-like domain
VPCLASADSITGLKPCLAFAGPVAEGADPWFVEDDEELLLVERPAWGYGVGLVAKALLALAFLGTGAYLALARWLPNYTDLAPVVAVGLLVVAAVWAWRRCVTSLYVVTDKRLYAKRGRLLLDLHLASHDRVTDVRYDRGPIDRLLGVGHLRFATAGADVGLPGLADPDRVKRAATQARDAFVQDLLASAGLDAQALETPPAPEPETVQATEPAEPGAREPAAEPARRPRIDPASQDLAPYEGPQPDYVASNETVQWLAKPSKAVLVNSLGFVLVLASFVASASFAEIAGGYLPFEGVGLATAIVVGVLAFQWLRLENTALVLTDERVYLKRGIVATNVNQITYDKVTDIAYDEGIVGRVLGFATLEVNTSGSTSTPISVNGITEPLAVKRLLEDATEA